MTLFPFKTIRPEQNKLIQDIAQAIKDGKNIITHAPTGLGKTAAAIAPALEYALENDLTVFFLTSRHTQHNIVIETLQKINKIKPIIAVDFIGKKGMCPQLYGSDARKINFVEFCSKQRKEGSCILYKNTLNGGKYTDEAREFGKMFTRGEPLNVEDVVSDCRNQFCAYELSMKMAQKANVIVGDYYHIFSPKIQAFFLNKIKKDLSDAIIIVDEAHNLAGRIRNLLTRKINSYTLAKAVEELEELEEDKFASIIVAIIDELKILARNRLSNESEIHIKKEEFIALVETAVGKKYSEFVDALEKLTDDIEDPDEEDNIGTLLFFLRSWHGPEEGFVRIFKKEKTRRGKEFFGLEYNCLSPSTLSKSVFNTVHSAILMSGTLVPTEMYRDVLGLSKSTILKVYSDPFPKKNRQVLISPDITTKFTERTEQMFKKIATSCAYVINNVNGNSAVFFPSYDILNKTLRFLEGIASKKLFIEARGMTKEERSELIGDFKRNLLNGGGAILGVMGASFSEGIDLPGDLLKAVAVVGIPLAPPDLTQKALINYYETNFGKGWDYGYIFPAMNRALQAAGRCIRSEKDKGVIAFFDKRFSWPKYSKIIPPDWNARVVSDFSKVEYF